MYRMVLDVGHISFYKALAIYQEASADTVWLGPTVSITKYASSAEIKVFIDTILIMTSTRFIKNQTLNKTSHQNIMVKSYYV